MIPVYKNPKLKGLRSFTELSTEEQDAYRKYASEKYPKYAEFYLTASPEKLNRYYDNYKFAQMFGDDAEKKNAYYSDPSLSKEEAYQKRSALYRDKIVNDALVDKFSDSPEQIDYIKNLGLTQEGLIDVLESDYKTPKELRSQIEDKKILKGWTEGRQTLRDNVANENLSKPSRWMSGFADVLLGGPTVGTQIVSYLPDVYNSIVEDRQIEKNNAILTDIVKKDQNRRKEIYQQTGIPQEIEKDVRQTYLNANSINGSGREVLEDMYSARVGDSYIDELGHYLYKSKNTGELVYRDNLGEEVSAPEYIKMSPKEAVEYNKERDNKLKELKEKIETANILKKGRVENEKVGITLEGTALEDYEQYEKYIGKTPEEAYLEETAGNDAYMGADGNWYRKIKREKNNIVGAYTVFHDRKEFDESHLSDDDLIKLISDFDIFNYFEGSSSAYQKASLDIESHLGENQNKFLPSVAQTFSRTTGGFMNTAIGISHNLFYSDDEWTNVMLGKNRDGSDKEVYGLDDPYYWHMVETAGSFDPGIVNNYIKTGYSPYAGVFDPTSSEWSMGRIAYEALPMAGYALEQYGIAKGIGAATKGLSNTVRGKNRFQMRRNPIPENAPARTPNRAIAGTIVDYSQMFTVPVINSMGIAHGYAAEALNNVYNQGLEKIEALREQDAEQYANSFIGTPEYIDKVNQVYEDLYAQYSKGKQKYINIINDEGETETLNAEEYARLMANQKVKYDLMQKYIDSPELQVKHNGRTYDDMVEKLKKDAHLAYSVDFGIEAASQSLNFAMFKSWLMTKEQRAMFNRKPTKFGFTEGGKKAWADMSLAQKAKVAALGWGKAGLGGALSNFNDEIRRDWSQTWGIEDFNDYIGFVTNPNNYTDQNDYQRGFWAMINAANSQALKTAGKESTWKAGFVGGIGSMVGFGPNIFGIASAIVKPRETFKKVDDAQIAANLEAFNNKEYDKIVIGRNTNERGEKIGKLDVAMKLLDKFLQNSFIQNWQEAGERMERTNDLVKSYNKFIDEHEDEIVGMSNLMETALRDYNMALNGRGHYLNETIDGEGSAKKRPISYTGAYIDNRSLMAFELIRRVSEYGGDEKFMGSDYLRNAYNQMNSILRGNQISQDLINEFLADKTNRAETRNMSEEEKQEYARTILQDRLKEMRKIADSYNEAREKFSLTPFFTENDNSAFNQLVFQYVMDKNWNKRLNKINEEIGSGKDHSPFYYGSFRQLKTMQEAQEKQVQLLEGERVDLANKIRREKNKRVRTNLMIRKSFINEQHRAAQEKLKQLNKDMDMWKDEYSTVSTVLSAEEILSLNPAERDYMLNESDEFSKYKEFSEEQQIEIERAKTILVSRFGDVQIGLDKINDARTLSERIDFNRKSMLRAIAYAEPFMDMVRKHKDIYHLNLLVAAENKLIEEEYYNLQHIQDNQGYSAMLKAFKDSKLPASMLKDLNDFYYSESNADHIVLDEIVKERQLEEDYIKEVQKYNSSLYVKQALLNIMGMATENTYTESEAMGELEKVYADVADNPTTEYEVHIEGSEFPMYVNGADLAIHLNNILTNLEKINHMRNSAVIYDINVARKEQARIAEERRVAAQKELAAQKARAERIQKEREAIELRESRLKQTAEREYADSRERMIEPTNAKDYAHFKEQAKTLAKHYVSQMLNGKSLRALKSSIAKDNIDASGLIEVIQKYRNAEKLYGYLWNKSANRTVAAIESALHEAGYTWESIEGKVIDESTQKDIIINNTRHDDSLPKGAIIAENATPYIYKDEVLISKPRTDVVIGMKEMSDEELAPRKEWRKKKVGFRQYENELVEVEYKPYIKKKFSTVVRKTKKDRILDYIRVNGLDSGLSATSKRINILIQIANGTKFKWIGEDVNKGIGNEMGQIESESERKAYEGIIDETNGITPTELYEALNADLEDYLADSDDKYTLDDVMDVISEINSPYKAWQELENIVSESMSTEEKQAEAAREAQRQAERQAYAEARGFESWEALMNETDKEAEILENELREEYNAYMESQDRQEVEDEERLKEAEQHEKSFEGELNEWKEAINQLYFDEEEITINEENGTEETTTQLEGQPTTDEGGITEGSEVLQGQQPTVTSGVERTQSNQTDIESQSTDGIPSESQPTVRPRGISAVQQKLPSEKTTEEEVADELIENPDEDINVIKISDIPPTIDRSTERIDRLWGNAMYRFNKAKLENQGIYDTTQPEEAKAKRALQQFLDDNNIHLQDIIDFELGQILNAYPNMKIRFMKTKGSNNVYNVIEYTDGVARLHDNDRGGIIESNGKKWLVVGVLGYMFAGRTASEQVRRISTQQAQHFNPISQQLDSEMQNSKEKFYVSESMYTKVLEQSNGYVTNRTSENEKIVSRSLKDMLADKNANPHKLQFGTLKFGVQKGDNFIVYNIGNERFFPPKDKIKKGSSYVLVPAANGSYVPMYINAVTYNQINDGRLKSTIDSLLMRFADRVATPTIEAARLVQRELEQYIAFGNNTTGVKLALHDDGTVQILVNGVPIDTTTLGNINAAFLNTLKKQNLRINVGKEVFTRRATFDMYAEAGALDIDSQILGFRGSMYNVSPINTNGTPVVTTRIYEGVMGQQSVGDASTKRTAGTARYGNLAYHRLTSNPDVWLSSDGVEVTDYELLEKLKYAEFIGMHKNNPNYTAVSKNTKRVTQYYIYDDGNKLGLRYDVYSDTLEIMTSNEYDRMILAIKDEAQKKAATEALRQSKPAEASLWEESPTEPAKQPTEEETKKEETQKPVSPIKTPSSETRNLQVPKISGTFALEDIIRGRAGKEAQNTIREALKEVVKKFNITKPSLPNILRTIESKGVSTTNITNLEDWIDNVLNCH